ncbi:hypothetical protein LR48_Vigan11g030900 [Vigna angularis]|uniref:Uncharacterized protein n=1 Tax=Phaseolus angularis TaxID=3914 RepID=A0A0L9VQW6_PHAAN|nr:hypothetical protein LR48_Vigan11g030900 [Vigna angularis]
MKALYQCVFLLGTKTLHNIKFSCIMTYVFLKPNPSNFKHLESIKVWLCAGTPNTFDETISPGSWKFNRFHETSRQGLFVGDLVASRVSFLSVQICFRNSSESAFKEKGSIIESHERPIFWTSIPILDERPLSGRTCTSVHLLDERPLLDERFERYARAWTSVSSVMHERGRASTFWTSVYFLDERPLRAERASLWNERAFAM